jgi:hypothetical protein
MARGRQPREDGAKTSAKSRAKEERKARRPLRLWKWKRLALLAVGVVLFVVFAGALVSVASPSLGAQGAGLLRVVLGDQTTASVESAIFRAQDLANGIAYRLGLEKQSTPWAVAAAATAGSASPRATTTSTTGAAAQATTTTTTPSDPWPPNPVPALGASPGEGRWSAYLTSAAGEVLGYRTVLRPDPARPYAFVVVVAIDLTRTRLHFVLGTKEPVSTVAVARPGRIPAADRAPGHLLATFNGGFQARHGHFGAMAGGVAVLPPRPGLGTVALYKDGRIKIGAWGGDVVANSGLAAWRQNGPLIIDQGSVNPHTGDAAPQDWGITVGGGTTTWRSGIGLSADGRTLFYAAGQSLTLPALANAMVDAGVSEGMQLDINRSWAHFEAIQPGKAQTTSPLFDAMPADRRYLGSYTRDFFYLTVAAT